MFEKFEKKTAIINGSGNIEGEGLEKRLPAVEVKNENLIASNSRKLTGDFFDNYISNSNLVTKLDSEYISNLKGSLLNEVFD